MEHRLIAAMAQMVERILGKDEVISSILISSFKASRRSVAFFYYRKICTFCKKSSYFIDKSKLFLYNRVIIIYCKGNDPEGVIYRKTFREQAIGASL